MVAVSQFDDSRDMSKMSTDEYKKVEKGHTFKPFEFKPDGFKTIKSLPIHQDAPEKPDTKAAFTYSVIGMNSNGFSCKKKEPFT